jgi:hypothetical protein
MKPIPIVQFVRPNAEKRFLVCDVSDEVHARYVEVVEPLGLRITAECVTPTSLVSICIEEPDLGDFACVLAENSKDEPGIVRDALEAMIRQFNADDYAVWKGDLLASDE